MNKLAQALNKATNITLTENGGLTNKSTNSALLDLFSQINAYRAAKVKPESRITRFRNALGEDVLLTTKMLFWSRDVRGGQGERNVFRVFLKELANTHPNVVKKNLIHIPEYGRWDDVFCLKGTALENDVVELIKEQLKKDIHTEHPSLLAKWLPSVNTSSKETRKLANWLIQKLNLNPIKYRKLLSKLRAKIRIVEGIISRNKWSNVDYEKVPSNAGLKYRKAFKKHDTQRYVEYLNQVQKGEKKIKAATLYPYDIVNKMLHYNRIIALEKTERQALDLMWKNLPDYFEGKEENSLVVVDASGSMYSGGPPIPLHVAFSIGLYCAERNKGIWHNQFISFADNPQFHTIKGLDLADKLTSMFDCQVGYSTNVEAVFMLILRKSIENRLKQEDLPNRVYIISDMEFNAIQGGRNKPDETIFRTLQRRYAQHGYEMPELVFWNVAARNVQFPMSMDDRGFMNVSGCNPSILKSLLSNKNVTAYDLMLETLNNKRYDLITV